MIDEVRSAFMALRTQESTGPDLKVLAFNALSGAYAGIDESTRQHVLLAVQTDTPLPAGIPALSMGKRTLVIGGVQTTFLDIICMYESLGEVFDHFVSAVLEHSVATGQDAAESVTTVLERWKNFLTAAQKPPGRDKLASVFGELLVVLDIVREANTADISYWLGPFGGRHDVRSGSTAIEVKTSQAHTSRKVTIHGEDQLVAPDNGRLYLHFVRLEQVPGNGRSVSSVVDELLMAGVPAETLFNAIAAAGIPVSQLPAAAEMTFDVRERLTLPIDGRTPRIIPESFAEGHRPLGVVDINYTIDLDPSLDLVLNRENYLATMKSIGKQAVL